MVVRRTASPASSPCRSSVKAAGLAIVTVNRPTMASTGAPTNAATVPSTMASALAPAPLAMPPIPTTSEVASASYTTRTPCLTRLCAVPVALVVSSARAVTPPLQSGSPAEPTALQYESASRYVPPPSLIA